MLFAMFGEKVTRGKYSQDGALLDDCPRLRALLEAVAAHPKVAEWNRKHNNIKS